ncbi:MAG: hypothetical protein RR336_01085 [Oscillospiraceae bacterium]
MTKIINGAKYSTETARCVASWDNGIFCNDFRHCSEDLYRTKSGKYFLYGYGGPMSRYAEHHGNDTSGGERIIPMSEDQARTWAEENVDGDTYELVFGMVSDDEELLPMNIRITPAAREKLDAMKLSTGLNLGTIVSAAINAYAGK